MERGSALWVLRQSVGFKAVYGGCFMAPAILLLGRFAPQNGCPVVWCHGTQRVESSHDEYPDLADCRVVPPRNDLGFVMVIKSVL